MADKIRILFLAANPTDMSQLRLGEEAREIDRDLAATNHRDRFEFQTQLAVRMSDFQQALLKYQPHIVHFSGHGTPEEGIVLQDNLGQSQPVGAKTLAKLFAALKDNIRIVVLNACYSKSQARAISKVIDYTIGMSTEIGDEAAVEFSASFYRALGFGRSVKEAFELAKVSLMVPALAEDQIPRLIVRKGAGMNQALLEPCQPSDSQSHQAGQNQPDNSTSHSLTIGGKVSGSTIIVGNHNSSRSRRRD
jgi:CHAT domain-containing protein